MDISKVNQNFSDAMKAVDKNGMVTIEKHGKPAYVIMTQDFFKNINTYFTVATALSNSQNEEETQAIPKYTLHEAMGIVLGEHPDKTMRYTDLANEIWNRALYKQRNGKKAPSSQILLRAKNYPTMFFINEDNKHDITLL